MPLGMRFSVLRGLMVLGCIVVAGCTQPAKGVDGTSKAAAIAQPATSAGKGVGQPSDGDASQATNSTASAIECSSDGECRMLPSYCADTPCACMGLAVAAPEPVCASGQRVACLMDPCRRNAAVCEQGKCVVVPLP